MKDTAAHLKSIIGGSVILDADMSAHTSLGTGGTADLLVIPDDIDSLKSTLSVLLVREVPTFLMGCGSNLLVRSGGFRGAVVKTGNVSRIGTHKVAQTDSGEFTISADCGARLSTLAKYCAGRGLRGLEFAAGIPGSIGGGVYMNAGAFDSELGDFVESVTALDENLTEVELPRRKIDFGYRTSSFQTNGLTIMTVKLRLKPGSSAESMALIKEYAQRRADKQPLDLPSAGSAFKRPEGYFAGALIEECGLKGCAIGGAQVSEKHAGFIVNTGGASPDDVEALVRHVRNVVFEKKGVLLEPEIRFIGDSLQFGEPPVSREA